VTITDKNDKIEDIIVHIVVPTAALQHRIQQLIPRQKIQLQGVGDSIVLSGEVDNPTNAERIVKMVESHLAALELKHPVLNFLNVSCRKQVQLRVKIAEVSRNYLRQSGMNAWFRRSGQAGGLLAPGTPLASGTLTPNTDIRMEPGDGVLSTGETPLPLHPLAPPFSTTAFGLLFSNQDAFPLSVALNLLAGKGLAKIYSEPTLIAYSGEEAQFLSGGEFPVPIPQGNGSVGITYKKYGVILKFKPNILTDRLLRLKMSIEVSDRDRAASVTVGGLNIPALTSRSSETTVELKHGQSFAIAGLVQDTLESMNYKMPLLGDLPLVGMLFRHVTFQRVEKELIIFVTAHFVQPLRPNQSIPLPREYEVFDGGNLRFFLLGQAVVDDSPGPRRIPVGPVGFSP
jgi:pilus assembly protein CpaC